mgnify:CR=1 FL=1
MVTDKLDNAGDRVVWETPTEMLDDIWLARNQRDTWRKIAGVILTEWVPRDAKDAYVDLLMYQYPEFAKAVRNESD